MSLAEGVLGIIEAAQQRQGFEHVRVVRLEIGALAGVEVEALRHCLQIVLHRSVARDASIEFTFKPGSGFCLDCGENVPITTLYADCPQCSGAHVQATGGLDMRVLDLTVH
jgi:hydrogenase nickel incorporation protein HypA/HybF